MSKELEISFKILNVIDTGIYECEPIGKTYGYPIWVVCAFDFTLLKTEDLSSLDLHKIEGKEQYVSNTNKGEPIFVIPKTVFMKLSEDDEDGSFGYYKASGNFTDNPYKPDLAKEMREKVKENENTTTTPTTTRVKVAPQLLRNQRQPRDLSPEPKNDYGKNIREKLFEMIESYEPTQPMTSDFKKKKSLKKSLKKNKKSLKKSKTSIKCKKIPYAWKPSSIKKSPFRTT